MCVGRRTIDKVIAKDYPEKSPCTECTSGYINCVNKSEARDELWTFLAKRGDWVMEQNA